MSSRRLEDVLDLGDVFLRSMNKVNQDVLKTSLSREKFSGMASSTEHPYVCSFSVTMFAKVLNFPMLRN